MRRYRNITDEELVSLGAVPAWDAGTARTLTPRSELLWVHRCHKKHTADDIRTIRRIRVLRIDETDITTNFGTYALSSGINTHPRHTHLRLCDGRVYQLASQH